MRGASGRWVRAKNFRRKKHFPHISDQGLKIENIVHGTGFFAFILHGVIAPDAETSYSYPNRFSRTSESQTQALRQVFPGTCARIPGRREEWQAADRGAPTWDP